MNAIRKTRKVLRTSDSIKFRFGIVQSVQSVQLLISAHVLLISALQKHVAQ